MAKKRRQQPRKKPFSKKLYLELLEDRTLLDNGLTNTPLTAAQRDNLLRGLQGLNDWANALGGYNQITQQLTLVNRSIGQALDLGDALRQGLTKPVVSYFAGDPSPTSAKLIGTLRRVSA